MSSCAGDVRRPASRVAVIEAKGLGGSAGERNSAQLEKWVAETDPLAASLDESYRLDV
jgi:hypothetical protein